MTSRTPECQTILIEPLKGWERLNLHDVWEYRELLYFFIWRNLKVSYARTKLGFGWAVLKPMLTVAVFTLIFGWLTQVPSDGIPYPLFVFSALLPWQLFARVVAGAGSSMVANENLITKVYFPRVIAPLSIAITALADFGIGFGMLLGMMWYYGSAVGSGVWALPLLTIVTMAAGLGVGLWLATLNAWCRDIGQAQQLILQLWLFATPVIYPASLIPEGWRFFYAINPMAGVVEGFRQLLLTGEGHSGFMILPSVITAVLLLISGLYVFRRTEQTIADAV